MTTPFLSPRVVIVGSGLAGTLVAIQLLRRATAGLAITLIERHPPVGRGVAYGTERDEHLLNVPADRMGVWPEDPAGFFKWVNERTGRLGFPDRVAPGDFLPRRLYGDYVAAVLNETRHHADSQVSFTVRVGEVVDIDELSSGSAAARVYLADGTDLVADQVVLALGNLPGEYPVRSGRQVFRSWRYVHVPWVADAIDGIDKDADVLIAGQGLTAADILIQLAAHGHRGRVWCLSRRGLRPLPNSPVSATYRDFLAGEPAPTTVRALVHRIRVEVRAAAARGVSWSAVIEAIRPHSQRLWLALNWTERSRFLRHVRPYWEMHRHRIAPALDAKIESLISAGRLEILAGHFVHLEETPDNLRVTWQPRGTTRQEVLTVAKLINCTGPRTDYSKYQHPLYINLLARGLIDHDPVALGVAALPSGEVLRYRGGPLGWLYTLGAPLKGVLWECTSAQEIRVQAAGIAALILKSAAAASAPSSTPPTRFQLLVADTKTRVEEVTVAGLTSEFVAGGKPLLIDVREPDEFAKGALPGAVHIPRGVLEGRIEEAVPALDADVVLYCAGGNRSALAADNLQKMGYTKIRSLAGGFAAWTKAGRPVTR
jgi:uncharacterized NAD(P)/FAD-binding protein YdhS/rhodanese-related sulfurtransferase